MQFGKYISLHVIYTTFTFFMFTRVWRRASNEGFAFKANCTSNHVKIRWGWKRRSLLHKTLKIWNNHSMTNSMLSETCLLVCIELTCYNVKAPTCCKSKSLLCGGLFNVFVLLGFRPTREFFTPMVTSPLPVKGCKFWHIFGTYGHSGVRVL